MRDPLKRGLRWAAASAAALPVLGLPLYNPDLFWHLSAGRWIWDHRALPYAEFLSFTPPSRPWLDFEWLAQLVFHGVHGAFGLYGLWALKIGLLLACWRVLDLTLRDGGASQEVRAGSLVLWAAGTLASSDIRPELFSLLLFCVCLRVLEGVRQGRIEPRPRLALKAAALFALWSSLHGGFAFALTLGAVYAAGEIVAGRARRAAGIAGATAAGALGALVNPYGWGPYRVILDHLAERGDVSRYITEWQPLSAAGMLHWPLYGLLALTLAAIGLRLAVSSQFWRAAVPWGAVLACGHFGANTLLHARVGPFFAIVAVLFLALVAEDARGWFRRFWLAAVAAAAAFTLWLTPQLSWSLPFSYRHVPRAAAAYMDAQQPVLSPLRLYNEWEWGGYLSWRLRPWYRSFVDGRYVFHDHLALIAAAARSPDSWQEFLAARRLNGALVANRAQMFPTPKFPRPWYVGYFPKDKWALVYWDDQALLFVERRAMPAAWLASHEYKWLRPRDEAAFQDALKSGKIPKSELEAEKKRHEQALEEGTVVKDEAAAVAIAMKVVADAYSAEHVEREKPFTATLAGGVWTVRGTLPKAPDGSPALGGVAEVTIRAKDGVVLSKTHGQ